jgi:hypothetical protein
MFANMAVEYSRTGANRRGRPPGSKSAPKPQMPQTDDDQPVQDERAIRAAMEDAVARRAQNKRVA